MPNFSFLAGLEVAEKFVVVVVGWWVVSDWGNIPPEINELIFEQTLIEDQNQYLSFKTEDGIIRTGNGFISDNGTMKSFPKT